MESVARKMGPSDMNLSSDIGNIIDISDPSDSLGLSMLANSGGNRSSSSDFNSSKHITIDTRPSNQNNGMSEIELSSLEPLEPITLNLGGSGPSAPIEIQFSKASDEKPSSFFGGDTGSSGGLFSNLQSASGPFSALSPAQSTRLSPEDERKEKSDLINKLQRLEAKGLAVSRRYTMDNTLEEIKQEYSRLVDARNLETSIRFQRQMMVGVVTGMQYLNDRFDPFDLKLDGWSESVHENIEDFDEIFEELYDKYKEKGKMPPEARLIMSLAGSGFMCHVSNTFLRSRMPSMDDVLKQNPEIARQFAAAAAKQAGPGFGNFMSMAMGAEAAPVPQQPSVGSFFGANGSAPMAQVPQPVAAMEPKQTARREMAGPSGIGVEDILKTFENVRRNEAMDGSIGVGFQVNTETQPAMAAIESQSIVSEDMGSMTESMRGRGGRRRRAVTGNTVSLAV
jgi:hypothetical protein